MRSGRKLKLMLYGQETYNKICSSRFWEQVDINAVMIEPSGEAGEHVSCGGDGRRHVWALSSGAVNATFRGDNVVQAAAVASTRWSSRGMHAVSTKSSI